MVDKVQAYFSRVEPFYLLREVTDSEGFDAYPVEVPASALVKVEKIKAILRTMTELFDEMPAPEERTQEEADALVKLLRLI